MDSIKAEYDSKSQEKQVYLNDLEVIIKNSGSPLEGNCIYYNATLHKYPVLYSKQLNLFYCGKQAVENICEIGFNAGHSTLLMLLGRSKTPLNFTVFDIGIHPYTKPSYEYIKNKFSFVKFEYIEGDSTSTMPKWINDHPELMYKYEVIHVDGGHSEHCISNDMKNSDLLLKKDGIMIIDDTHLPHVNKYVDSYISTGNYKEEQILVTYGYQHRVIRKTK